MSEAQRIARELGTPLVIHQPAYSLLNRWVEDGLLETLAEQGMGSIAFTPLAQGLLTDKYLHDDAAAPSGGRTSLSGHLTQENLGTARALNELAGERGQSLAQLAISWLLRPGDLRAAGGLLHEAAGREPRRAGRCAVQRRGAGPDRCDHRTGVHHRHLERLRPDRLSLRPRGAE